MMRIFFSQERRREHEALDWVQMLNGDAVSDSQMEEYLAWMEADTENADVFRQMDQAWIIADGNAEAIRARFGPEARASRAWFSNTVGRFFRPGWTPQFAAVLGVVLLVGVFVLNEPTPTPSVLQQFATVVGEQREVTLADGSVVRLNTASRIVVNLTQNLRTVTLASGGALFDVTPDPTRPFVVRTDGGAVEVLGTVFDILRKPEGFAVTVLEGRVSVSTDIDVPVPNKTIVLTPDQGAELNTRQASLETFTVDAQAATAWSRGQLIYRGAQLRDVLADIARYSPRPLSVAGSVPLDQKFTGVLTIEAPAEMMGRLASLLQLRVVSAEDGGLRLQPIE